MPLGDPYGDTNIRQMQHSRWKVAQRRQVEPDHSVCLLYTCLRAVLVICAVLFLVDILLVVLKYWTQFLSFALAVGVGSITYYVGLQLATYARFSLQRSRLRYTQKTCAVCLEELACSTETQRESETDHSKNTRLHVLLCGHAYHPECVSPWLDRQRTCPVCKQQV